MPVNRTSNINGRIKNGFRQPVIHQGLRPWASGHSTGHFMIFSNGLHFNFRLKYYNSSKK